MVELQCVRSQYTHTKIKRAQLDLTRLRLSSSGWVANALISHAARSEINPVDEREAGNIARALVAAAVNDEWVRLASLHPRQVRLPEAIGAFRQLETAITENAGGKEPYKYALSAAVRRLLRDYLVELDITGADRLHVAFRTTFRARINARTLISDSAGTGYPLGATPHSDLASLNQGFVEKFKLTRADIEEQCELELDASVVLKAAVERFFVIPPDEQLVGNLLSLDGKRASQSQLFPPWLKLAPSSALLAAYHAILLRHRPIHSDTFACVRTEELGGILADLLGLARPSGPIDLMRYIGQFYVGTANTMVAAAICVQFATGWNISSVLELDAGDIEEENGTVRIQGFKERTGEFTPPVYLTTDDVAARKALAFLQKRLQWMKEVNWVQERESRLWLHPLQRRRESPDTYARWPMMLRSFIAAHNLPHFTFEQLRVEVIAREAVGVGGLEAARRIAGHANELTTGEYLDQVLMHRRSSSINLEFQRRLERSVSYRRTSADPKDDDLLYAVGDGTSCTDPTRPPLEHYKGVGQCNGQLCHSRGGCPNNRIVIDVHRIEEVARLSRFYAEIWKQLFTDNPAQFNRYHLPALTFNFALRGVIATGPMRHELSKIERRLAEQPK